MLQLTAITSLGLAALLPVIFAYPQDPRLTPAVPKNLDPKFIFGAIGDSWASGVTFPHLPGNNYDDNKDGCMRYKYAWSTVVNENYAKWAPYPDVGSQFEFRACSGARLDSMKEQMDKLSRPKLVFMEVGGNNADFYPLADSCLFHQSSDKKYGPNWEEEIDSKNPTGECRKEIGKVRDRLTSGNMDKFQDDIKQTIHTWRGHKSIMGNDATLLVLGYGRFFALDQACDEWSFNVFWASKTQNVVSGMRKEINDLTDLMNTAIQKAVESFNDKKIQYVNTDPAFEGHRFCEPGHSWLSQLNYGNDVWIWNSPARLWVTIKIGDVVTTYEPDVGPPPPTSLIEQLLQHRDGNPRTEGEYSIVTFRDPNNSDITMEWKAKTQDIILGPTNGGGSVARTLHPTQDGHQKMGDIVVQRLEQIYKNPNWRL